DIAQTLRGQASDAQGARPLLRRTADQAPSPEGPGWLSATEPRNQLAELLNASPDDVVLMFYVPLPAGAQPLPPPPLATKSRLGAPSPSNQDAAPSGEDGVGREPSPASSAERRPTLVAASLFPVGANPLLIRARYAPAEGAGPFGRPPAGFAGRARTGGFPAAGIGSAPRPSGLVGGLGSPRPSPAGRPWSPANQSFSAPGVQAASRRLSPSSAPTASAGTARPFAGQAWARPVAQIPGSGTPAGQPPFAPSSIAAGASRPPVLSDRARALVGAFADRRRAMVSTGAVLSASATTTLSLASTKSSEVQQIEKAGISPNLPTRAAASSEPPVSAPSSISVSPIVKTAPTITTAPLIDSQVRASAETIEPVMVSTAPIRRGLFSTQPAGYIEGDFIAAQRIGDRWIVVEPKPEGFPSAWQSRVMLWFLLSFALVAPLGWLFARRITAPLRSFADAAERLGRDPSSGAVVQGGSAEIGRAAAAFNQMQARLK
ncbi:hypothetical protein LTR94_026527, partial [Friedmanniomyces endolithicus]